MEIMTEEIRRRQASAQLRSAEMSVGFNFNGLLALLIIVLGLMALLKWSAADQKVARRASAAAQPLENCLAETGQSCTWRLTGYGDSLTLPLRLVSPPLAPVTSSY